MTVYMDGVMLLNFLVDLLLLLAANRLSGYPPGLKRAVSGAILGAVYAGICLIPELRFLGNVFWRTVFFVLMALISYGISKSALRRGFVFVLLSMALGGVAMGFENVGMWSIIPAAGILYLLCTAGFKNPPGSNCYVPVELEHGAVRLKLTALCDTGNTLKDPLTGRPVLVVGPEAAQKLTGLTRQQLLTPVDSVGVIPGLRLIPYHSVGQAGGMLLALRMKKVQIGTWKGSSLVAFAPDCLSSEGTYQALTGGNIC